MVGEHEVSGFSHAEKLGFGVERLKDFHACCVQRNGLDPVSFGYDQDSLLVQAGALSLARDPQNRRVTGTSLGNVSDTWTYNGFGEPAAYTAAYGGNEFYALQYTRDKLGRFTMKTENIGGVTDTYEYGYDAAGRLCDVTRNGGLISHYEYDPNGNRLSWAMSGTVSYSYDDQDRLLEVSGSSPQLLADYSYTPKGELLAKTDGTGTTNYNYDVQGNLMAVSLPNSTEDYKQQRDGHYENFGNFNYGATGRAFGFDANTLLRMAGDAQIKAGTSKPGWGDPQMLGPFPNPFLPGIPPYGDDPRDQYCIKKGIEYYEEYGPGKGAICPCQ